MRCNPPSSHHKFYHRRKLSFLFTPLYQHQKQKILTGIQKLGQIELFSPKHNIKMKIKLTKNWRQRASSGPTTYHAPHAAINNKRAQQGSTFKSPLRVNFKSPLRVNQQNAQFGRAKKFLLNHFQYFQTDAKTPRRDCEWKCFKLLISLCKKNEWAWEQCVQWALNN